MITLEKLALNRKQLAEHLNYNSYAEYIQETRMARNPETVWEFENNLINKVREKGKLDHDEVLAIKIAHTGDDSATVVYSYLPKYNKTKYGANNSS